MAMHKLNVLHWHLTDDQAWRIRSANARSSRRWRGAYPGCARDDIDPAKATPTAALHAGQIRSIVAYAKARAITIVPEIDVPGHTSAMIAAYPRLGEKGHPVAEVPADWGVFPHGLNSDEATFRFVEDVFAEVMQLFPGPFIHKGGDEIAKDPFTARLSKFSPPAPKLVGWDDILTTSRRLPRG